MTMALDNELIRAVEEAVKEVGQPSTVAKRIIAWLEAMSSGETTRSDLDDFLKTTLTSIVSKYSTEES